VDILLFAYRFSEQFSESQAAFCKHSQGQIAAVRSRRELMKRFSKLVCNFIEANRNFDFDFQQVFNKSHMYIWCIQNQIEKSE
jgi:hypothetical protein